MRSARPPYSSILESDVSNFAGERRDTGNLKIDLQRSLQLLDEAVGVSPSSPSGRSRVTRHTNVLQPKASSSLLEPVSRRFVQDVRPTQRAGQLPSFGASIFHSPASIRSSSVMSPVLASPAGRSLLKQPLNQTDYDEVQELSATYDERRQVLPEAQASFMLDESQLTSTNAALLLSEGSTDLANLGGIYVDFETATRDHMADNRAFDLVGAFIQILESQTCVLKKLIDKVAGSQQRFKQVHTTYTLLCSELCTWRLVDSLYRDIVETEAKEATAGSLFGDGSESMNVDDDAANPMQDHQDSLAGHGSEKLLVDRLFELSANIRRRQVVVDWLETEAGHKLADLGGKVQFYRDGSTAAWENTLHVLKKTAGGRSFGVRGASSSLVTELDPDAPHRQGKDLHHLDKEDEICLLKNVFAGIRAGKLDEAQALCVRCGQAWRAASLEGWRLYHDPNFSAASSTVSGEPALAIEGNLHRDIWKSMCWSIAEQESVHVYERAVYASLSGNLAKMLPVCESWEDCLWAYFRASIDLQMEQHVRLSAANAATTDRAFVPLPDDYWNRNVTLEKIFEEVECQSERTRKEGQTCYHLMQKFIILNDVKGLLAVMRGLLRSPAGTAQPAHLLRFMAHLVLFLKKIGRLMVLGVEDGDAVIAAYVRQLVADKRQDLVATYTALLPPEQQVEAYASFLEGIRDRSARVRCLDLASDAGLDTCTITKALVENVLAKSAARFDITAGASSAKDFTTSENDLVCIDALEWLTFDPLQRVEAIVKANCVMRAFIAMGKLAAARDAFTRVPADFVELVVAQQDERQVASAVASNAVKEYLCIRAYLDAQDAFNDWFQHFHNKKPQPPQPEAAAAGFAERVAQEQRAKQHDGDVQRWTAASQLQATTTVEKLYNVLLFPNGGWMVDVGPGGPATDGSITADDDQGNREDQLSALRRLCLPMVSTLLVTVFTATGRHSECLRLADLIASEQHRLYEAFTKDDLRRLLQRLRESSLALLDANTDPLGYGSAGRGVAMA